MVWIVKSISGIGPLFWMACSAFSTWLMRCCSSREEEAWSSSISMIEAEPWGTDDAPVGAILVGAMGSQKDRFGGVGMYATNEVTLSPLGMERRCKGTRANMGGKAMKISREQG